MARLTYFVVVPFAAGDDGELVPGDPVEARDSESARRMALRLTGSGAAGALAFSRAADPDIGVYEDAVVIDRVGTVPSDWAGMFG
ncbi:hypothetical protein [Pseudoxanthobacter sp.]|uniref:hypothetical protein n=1 Tax=Pseudoxanthobacter sp. TaxID=1925742 RepID=UPI002FE28F0B